MPFDLPPLAQIPSVQLTTQLGPAAWAVLVGVPVGIIALYFLKLRRRPVEVPSTLLWRRSLEDLHVNSLFQRLRKNLLLFLQLLAVLLAMLALLGPRLKGTSMPGQKYVLVIDESASMGATDVSPSRLDRAKAEASKIVANMQSDDLAMVIAFSDRARVVSNYTSNRALLQQRIAAIRPTQAPTSLLEALQVAAGLANPKSDLAARDLPQGVVAVNALIPPKLFVFTDGGFPDVEGFSLGNLEPEVVVLGPPPPADVPVAERKDDEGPKRPSDNVGVLSLQAARNDEKPDQFQVFGRVHNYRDQPVETEAKLLKHDPKDPNAAGSLVDAIALTIDAGADQSFKFDLPDQGAVELEVRLDVNDSLPIDSRAYTVFGNPRKAQVLLVSTGDRYLVNSLRTETTEKLARVTVVTPEEYKAEDVTRDVATGKYDLIIYDRFRPEVVPEANALYFGAFPPGPQYDNARTVEAPAILDWNLSHPLLQYIRDLRLVLIKQAKVIELPPGATSLIDSNEGPLAFIVPRSGYLDAVVTFPLVGDDRTFNSSWQLYLSFPMFLYNSLRTLGNARESAGNDVHQPGRPVVFRAESMVESVEVTGPDGRRRTLKRTPQGTFVDNEANSVGFYHARWADDGLVAYTVNLFDSRESDLATRGLPPEGVAGDEAEKYKIKIGYNAVKGSRRTTPAQKDWWKPLAALALAVLLLEWWIYNRRVYI